MLLKCGRSAVRSMVSVCSHSGANHIRSSVLVELDLEVKCVGLQSQREAVNGVGLRAGGVGLGGGPTISGRACWWSWTWRRNIRGSMVSVCSHSGANNIRSSVVVGPTISGRLVGPTISGRACWWGQLLAASGRRDEALYQALGARLRTRRVRAVLCVGLVRTN